MGHAKPEIEVADYVREPIGVSTLLPSMAAAHLVAAAERAGELPVESVERKRLIKKAIADVKRWCPQAFRDRGENSRSE